MFRGVTFLFCWIFAIIMAETNGNNGVGADAFATTGKSEGGDLPKLPPPDPDAKNIPTFKLGETIRFEEWGPVILNSDGSMRRIENWDQLTEKEKEVTWRRISKRNEERRKILLAQQQDAQGGAESNEL
jgi:hypothetical protein